MPRVRFNSAGSVTGLEVPEELLYKHSQVVTAKIESGSAISQIGLEGNIPDFKLELGPSRQVNLHEMPALDEQGRLIKSTVATMDCLLVFPDRIVGYNPFPVVLLAGSKLSELRVASFPEAEDSNQRSNLSTKKAA